MHASSLENMQFCFDLLESRPESPSAPGTVLDVVGHDTAEGYQSVFTDSRLRYVSVAVDHAAPLPFDDDEFDLVVSGHLPGRQRDLETTLREMTRVASRDGFIVLVARSAGGVDHPLDTHPVDAASYAALANAAGCHLLRTWVDERGPGQDLVGIFAKKPATLPDRPRRVLQSGRAAPRSRNAEHDLRQGRAMYLDVLANIHTLLKPRHYLEIGVHRGASLRLASCSCVAVDPDPRVTVTAPTAFYNETSDDFFHYDAEVALQQGIDLAFIDGLHLFENVLRDFMNIERLSGPATVVVIDDVLPNHPAQALRDRQTFAWCGDVWKIVPCLTKYRPDLQLSLLDSDPTGLLVVAGLDSTSRLLREHYNSVVAEYLSPEHAAPPQEVIDRRNALAPDDRRLLDSLRELRAARG
jgi:predicted O-methyltransferase YrrM